MKKMKIEKISKGSKIPAELILFKIQHYKDVFRDEWKECYSSSPLLDRGEEQLVLYDSDKIVGGCVIKKDTYFVQFSDFAILPENRGKGHAKYLMNTLEEITKEHHKNLIASGKKPEDIDMMYLKSLIYLDSQANDPKIHALAFSAFLKKNEFKAYMYNKLELCKKEKKGLEVYAQEYSGLFDRLKVFKKTIIDNGVKLSSKIQQELLCLDKHQKKIVLDGLNWKLGNYNKSGKISYRYDLCPICSDVKSSEQNSKNCKKCYIHLTCMAPFREIGRFKEDFEISHAYFTEMRAFLVRN